MKESFTNPGMKPLTKNPFLNAKKTNSQFIDSYVPSNLGYSDITTYYNSMDDTLKGTSLVNVSAVDSKRYPIMIETPTNWYNTQPMVLKDINVGSNWGKLPMSDCILMLVPIGENSQCLIVYVETVIPWNSVFNHT